MSLGADSTRELLLRVIGCVRPVKKVKGGVSNARAKVVNEVAYLWRSVSTTTAGNVLDKQTCI